VCRQIRQCAAAKHSSAERPMQRALPALVLASAARAETWPDHPLRLVIPVKYGIKNIKRIGLIRFTNSRPADYWAEEGYDWYAGL
jgi:DMSO/TMAO reductase YedYZ molybdopterin-dependent catalytic subunit